VNTSPYEKGWLIKVKLSNSGELNSLMDDDKYSKFCEGNHWRNQSVFWRPGPVFQALSLVMVWRPAVTNWQGSSQGINVRICQSYKGMGNPSLCCQWRGHIWYFFVVVISWIPSFFLKMTLFDSSMQFFYLMPLG